MIPIIFKLLGALGVFLYGMRLMSDGVQKVAGKRLQRILNYMTQNRVMAVLTGLLITALIQSSSATTVMVVSFVNASLLSLTQAIGVIIGANIGTTATTWIISLFGFKFNITSIALPIIGIGFPFILSKFRRRRDIGEVLVGFGLLFLGLMFLKNGVPDLKHHPEILAFLQNYTDLGFGTIVIFVAVGALLTIAVQSSSAAMAITITMAYKGWIGMVPAAAIVLGENIGTTITAYLASIGTTVNARRAARAHILFNVLGAVWVIIIFPYFLNAVLSIAPWDVTEQGNLPLSLAFFHTAFNMINTLVFVGLIPKFATVVKRLVPDTETDQKKEYKLEYLSTGIQDTPLLNIMKAKRELEKFARLTIDMFDTTMRVFNHPHNKMGREVENVKESEELTDAMQEEISRYLVRCSQDEVSEIVIGNINAMIRIVNELENVGDSCYNLIILVQRKYDKSLNAPKAADIEINDYALLVRKSMNFYMTHLNQHLHHDEIEQAYAFEKAINHQRDVLKKRAMARLQQGSNVRSELLYMDFVKYMEHIGDSALNISQALRQIH